MRGTAAANLFHLDPGLREGDGVSLGQARGREGAGMAMEFPGIQRSAEGGYAGT